MSDERKLSERFAEAAAAATPGPWIKTATTTIRSGEWEQRGIYGNRVSAPVATTSGKLDNCDKDAAFIALCGTERDRILEALRRDEDPRVALALRLLAICEQPGDEQARTVAANGTKGERAYGDEQLTPLEYALWNGRNACAALLALAKGTAP